MTKVVPGGTSGAPTGLIEAILDPGHTEFILGNGYFTGGDISPAVLGARPQLTIRASHLWAAKLGPLEVSANNITIDGVEITTSVTGIMVSGQGAQIRNCKVQGFGHTAYANGIWVLKSALSPLSRTRIAGNTITDWGIKSLPLDPFAAGIAVGKATDVQDIDGITIEITSNSITDGPILPGLQSAGIQLFFPALVQGNFVQTVSGSGVQMKTINSRVASNEFANILFDGAFNQRFPVESDNIWENNLVHDCDVGIDHYMGVGVVYQGNVFYNMGVYGRIKDFDVTTNLLIKNNTFYNSSGSAGFIWELTGGVTFRDILFQDNIWDTTNGPAIENEATAAWDEAGNIFWNSTPPAPMGQGSAILNPLLTSPPTNFAPRAPEAAGKGAPWPLPVFIAPARVIPLRVRNDYGRGGRRVVMNYKKRVMLG